MKLSVVVVSFNTKKLLKQTLEAVLASTLNPKDYEVFVADNNSKDGSPAMVKSTFPQVKLITNEENLGFARGNNQAIQKARGDYVLLLNSDTKVHPDALEKLVTFMDTHPRAGIASAQLLYADGGIQPSAGCVPRLSNIAAWMLLLDDLPFVRPWFWSYHLTRRSFYKKTRQVGWVQGAALVARSKALKEIGLLDEGIFMYGEDVDMGIRARKQGWQVWHVAEAKVIHFQFQSSKGVSHNAILGEYQGLKYIFAKHKPRWERPFLRFFLKVGAVLRIFLFGTIVQDKERHDIYTAALKVS